MVSPPSGGNTGNPASPCPRATPVHGPGDIPPTARRRKWSGSLAASGQLSVWAPLPSRSYRPMTILQPCLAPPGLSRSQQWTHRAISTFPLVLRCTTSLFKSASHYRTLLYEQYLYAIFPCTLIAGTYSTFTSITSVDSFNSAIYTLAYVC
jgi:hypothetical protein